MGFPFEHGLHSTLIAMRLADRLGVDRETVVADLLRVPALPLPAAPRTRTSPPQVFGGSLTTNLQPGHVRLGARGPDRAHPRAARPGQRGAGARASRSRAGCREWRGSSVRTSPPSARWRRCSPSGLGAPGRRSQGLLAHLTERWDGKGPLRRAKGRRSRCRCGSSTSPSTPPSSACSGAWSASCASSASAPGTRSTRRWPPASSTMPREILALDDARVGLGGGARLRAAPAADARGRGARSRARRDGQLRRPDLAVPGRSLGGRGGAGRARRRSAAGSTRPASSRSGARRSSTTSGGSRSTRGSGRSPGR